MPLGASSILFLHLSDKLFGCCERLRILTVQALGVFWWLKLETVEAWFFIWFPGSALDSSLGHHLGYLGFDASGPNVYISEGGDS